MKKLFGGAIVLVSLMAMPATAAAQLSPYYVEEVIYLLVGNDLMAVTSGNRRMVDEISRQGRRAIAYRSADLVLAPSGYGVVGPDGRFHRVSDRAGNLDPRVKVDYARAGVLGAASGSIAGSIFDSTRVGVGVGGAVALGSVLVDVARGRNRGRQQVAPAPVSPRGYPMAVPDEGYGQAVPWRPQYAPPTPDPAYAGYATRRQTCLEMGLLKIQNGTAHTMLVFVGLNTEASFQVAGGGHICVGPPLPNSYYRATTVPTSYQDDPDLPPGSRTLATMATAELSARPVPNGWEFIDPASLYAGEGVR